MKMRSLIIDNRARAEIVRVLAYATNHPYRIGDPVPGDNPNYVAILSSYFVVFTYTEAEGRRFRHLSISVPSDTMYPNPAAAFMLAAEFGFTGWQETMHPPEGWGIKVNEKEHCIVITQEIT